MIGSGSGSSDLFRGFGIEVHLVESVDFLKVRETLTRIGDADEEQHQLSQICYILHKKGRYRILHYKELMVMDGHAGEVDYEDVLKRNKVADLLDEWGLLELNDETDVGEVASMADIKVLAFKDKSGWTLNSPYQIGKRKTGI